jgi:hypothetical protein
MPPEHQDNSLFAEAAGRQTVWKEALKGWNMNDSQQVQEWIDEGVAQGEANAILRLLAMRFPPGPSAEITSRVHATTNLEQLREWFALAYTAETLDAFRQAAGI